jgi:hypothetical protein
MCVSFAGARARKLSAAEEEGERRDLLRVVVVVDRRDLDREQEVLPRTLNCWSRGWNSTSTACSNWSAMMAEGEDSDRERGALAIAARARTEGAAVVSMVQSCDSCVGL